MDSDIRIVKVEMEEVVDRIVPLMRELSPDNLSRRVRWLKARIGTTGVGLWVAVVGDKSAGYLMATPPDERDGAAWVVEAYADAVHIPLRASNAVWELVKKWAKNLGATSLKMMTNRPAEVWTRRYGFQPEKLVMRAEV